MNIKLEKSSIPFSTFSNLSLRNNPDDDGGRGRGRGSGRPEK
jgi:hypothetical protein